MLNFKLYVEVFSQKILVFVNGIDLKISSLFIHKSIFAKKNIYQMYDPKDSKNWVCKK